MGMISNIIFLCFLFLGLPALLLVWLGRRRVVRLAEGVKSYFVERQRREERLETLKKEEQEEMERHRERAEAELANPEQLTKISDLIGSDEGSDPHEEHYS